jgi:hypothetical protein
MDSIQLVARAFLPKIELIANSVVLVFLGQLKSHRYGQAAEMDAVRADIATSNGEDLQRESPPK